MGHGRGRYRAPRAARRLMARTKISASNWLTTGSRKRRTIKCWRREARSAKEEESSSPFQRHRGGRAAGEDETRIGFDRAVSPDPKFFDAPLSGIAAGRLRRAIDAGCQPDEMASRPHELVFRNLRPQSMDAGISSRQFREYAYLFNSYYNAAGDMHRRDLRGLISRPTVEETFRYRDIDRSMRRSICIANADDELARRRSSRAHPRFSSRTAASGTSRHRHQTRLRAKSASSRLSGRARQADTAERGRRRSISSNSTKRSSSIGHEGSAFSYDNEGPRHRALVPAFALASARSRMANISHSSKASGYAQTGILALVRLDDCKRTALAGAALLGKARREMVELHPLRFPPGR